MRYPTVPQINEAGIEQLVRWYRFLPLPGKSAVGTENFDVVAKDQTSKIELICSHIQELGGITPEVSKLVGWDRAGGAA